MNMPKPVFPSFPSEPTFTPAKAARKADGRSRVSGAVVVVEAAAYIVAAVIVAAAIWIGRWLNDN
jgi:hypothetical protein